MISLGKCFILVFFSFFFFFITPLFDHPAFALTATGCWLTKVGNPAGPEPTFPPECATVPSKGIVFPPNLGPCVAVPAENPGGVAGEYCKMPPPLHGEYTVGNTWGAKEMVGTLYTVAQRWKAKYPQGQIRIMDISGFHPPVSEHDWGVAVDINATTTGNDCVADMQYNNRICVKGPYNMPATIELGKMLIDTGYYDTVWYNDPFVQIAVFAYAVLQDPQKFTTNTSGKTGIRRDDGHENHFHFDIDRTGRRSDNHRDNFDKSKLQKCQTVSPKVC